MTGPRPGTVAATALFGAAIVDALPSVTAISAVRRGVTAISATRDRFAYSGGDRTVALTFDDGPDPAMTPAVLSVLAAAGVSATFFMLGAMVQKAPSLAREVADAGHEIAVHGWNHRCVLLHRPGAVSADISRSWHTVAGATGAAPQFYRPPYGILNARAIVAARRLEMRPVLWTAAGREWRPGSTAESVFASVSSDLSAGATVLLHDSDCTSPIGSAEAALGALPRLIQRCQELSLDFTTLSERAA